MGALHDRGASTKQAAQENYCIVVEVVFIVEVVFTQQLPLSVVAAHDAGELETVKQSQRLAVVDACSNA